MKNPQNLYLMEYFFYNSYVFGSEMRDDKTLPRKFSKQEVLDMASMQSNSTEWNKKKIEHQMDDDEF
jgi:hypothetical protein